MSTNSAQAFNPACLQAVLNLHLPLIMKTRSVYLALGVLLIVGFQNCSKSRQFDDGQDVQILTERVISQRQSFTTVTSDPLLEVSSANLSQRLVIDVPSKELRVYKNSGFKSCTLDQERINAFANLITNTSICEAAPLPEGMASCLAIGMTDIRLESNSSAFDLRPLICNNGVFLCEGRDTQLRALLQNVRENLPATCQ